MENNNTALTGVKMMIADGIVTQEAAEKYFPELKESEDEREQLIEFLWDLIYKGSSFRYKREDFERWKAWLEKQGETSTMYISGADLIKGLTHAKLEHKKQGEQKPADKVEPKFHEGDFVVDKWGHIFEITRIGKDYNGITYACSLLENPMFWSEYYEDEIRLWDFIKDAKAGDVLCWDDSKCIALFKNIYDNESFESYGFVGHRTGIFQPSESYHDIKGAHPATKVQRERFFAKMREAGYEWDAKKLELKKIKPIDEYEGLTDFERTVADVCIGFIGKELGWKQYVKDNADNLLKIAVKKL